MLIICPECGNSISDASKECIHCGFKLKKCKECGTVLGAKEEMCSNCGFEFTQNKPRKKEDSRTESEKIFEQEQKKAEKVATEIIKYNKIFRWIKWGLIILGIILYTIVITKLVNFLTYESKSDIEILKLFSNAPKIKESIHSLSLFGCLCFTVATFINDFKTLFYTPLVFSKIKTEKFDYDKYYKNYPVDEKGEVVPPLIFLSDNLFASVDVELTEIIRYKKDLPSIIFNLFMKILGTIFTVISIFLIYPALMANIDSLISMAMIKVKFNPIFVTEIIWGIALLLVKGFIIDLLLDNRLESAHGWVKKVHKEGKQDTSH